MRPWKIVLATFIVIGVHLAFIPKTFWEYDECLFAAGVEHYQPLSHHPPPPGYPLYMGFAKVLALFMTPFAALVLTSVLATIAGFLAWWFAFEEIGIDGFASVLLYLGPAVLISGTLPQSDAGALALFGFAAWACVRGNPLAMAILCAATVGWRQQFAIAIVPMFLVAVVMLKTWRARITSIVTFGIACVAWLIPLMVSAGGPRTYWTWLTGQASYYARHDADLSRSGYSMAQIAVRFVAHPWGPKWLSLPLLFLAAIGVYFARRNKKLLPLAIGCGIYLVFAVMTMDPADAVRYAIPALPLFAALFASWKRIAPLAFLFGLGAIVYAWPVLYTRATTESAPYTAAKWIRTHLPKDAVIVYDTALRPHAELLLPEWKTQRFEAGVPFTGPVYLYADGPGTVNFRWPDTDAYRKLTRQHYGIVSITESRVTRRFNVVEGVFGRERTHDGESWRWLGPRATIILPDLGLQRVRITLRAPPECPLGENRIEIDIHGRRFWMTVQRGATSNADLPIPMGPVHITFIPEKTFVPAKVPDAHNRDQRTLSVMLVRVEQVR